MSSPIKSKELEELRQNRCQRCGKVTDKLYRMGSGADRMIICTTCRSEFVGE